MIHYTKAYIKSLLDKYMDGTTTLEEEDILVGYFRGEDIPQEWEDYRQLFLEIEQTPAVSSETVAPQSRASRRWIGWSVAAAVVAGVLYLAIPSEQTASPDTQALVAQTDTTVVSPIQQTDTTSLRQEEVQPMQSKKKGLRKLQPTIHDYDKVYTQMAQVVKEQQEAEQQLTECQMEVIEAQLAAYGYIPVTQEDGTIIYINEQTDYYAYEE